MGLGTFVAACQAAFSRADNEVPAKDLWLNIAGCQIHLRIAGAALADVLASAFWHLRGAGNGAADLAILAWDGSETAIDFPALPGQTSAVRDSDAPLRFADAGRTVLLDVSRSQSWLLDRGHGIGCFFVAGVDSLPHWDILYPLRALFDHWGRPRRLHMLHAGAVAVGEAGVLVPGPPGAGKSTTVLACLAAGGRAAGDDCVFVEDREQIVAHSVYGAMRLFSAHAARYPFLMPDSDSVAPGHDGKPKLAANIPLHRADRMTPRLAIAAIVMPSVKPGTRSRAVPASGSAALLLLMPAALRNAGAEDRMAFADIGRICRTLPCWRLELGDDPESIPRLVAGIVARPPAHIDKVRA